MNHIYKSIFNKALGVFTAVPEFASAHGKGSERTVVGRVAKGTAGFVASALAISIGLALSSNAMANVDTDVASGVLRIADPTGTNSIRMGSGTTLDDANKQWNSVSIGVDAGVNTASSVAIGYGAKAGKVDKFLGQGAVALGYNAQALGTSGIAIGEDSSTTNGHNGVAIGAYSKTENEKSISIGAFSTASGAQSIVMSNNYDTNSRGPVSVASGRRSQIYGAETTVSGEQSVSIGDTNTIASARTYALGNNINVAAGADDSLVFGTRANVGGESSIAIGKSAKATKNWASAIGTDAIASGGSGSQAYGYDSVASGKSAIAQGFHSHANGQSAVAIGDNAKAGGIATVSVGFMANGQSVDVDKANTPSTNKATYGTAVGHYAGADYTGTDNERSTALGNQAGRYGEGGSVNTAVGNQAGMYVKGSQNIAMGNNAGSGTATDKLEVNYTTAIGVSAKALTNNSIAIGRNSQSGKADVFGGDRSLAIGDTATAMGTTSIAIGANSSTSNGHDSIALGTNASTSNQKATAIGSFSAATGKQSLVIANNYGSKGVQPISVASGNRATAIGVETTVSGDNSVSIGDTNNIASARTYALGNNINVAAGADDSLAFGTRAAVEGENTIAMGNTAKAHTENSISIGKNSESGKVDKFDGKQSVAIGFEAKSMGTSTIAMGSYATSENGHDGVAIGTYAKTGNEKAITIGAYSSASGAQSIVIANNYNSDNSNNSDKSTATGRRAIVMGAESHATAEQALAIGDKNTVAGARTYAIGNNINVAAGADDSLVFGTRAAVGGANAVAIGANANAAQANSVALGAGSTTANVHTGDYTLSSAYSAAGQSVDADGTVSVGSQLRERQIQNVAAGVISSSSTDAINGSQLYATNFYLTNIAGDVKTTLGGNAALGNDGHLTMSNIGGTGENTVDDAIKNLKTAIDNKVDTTASVTSENQADIKVDKEAPVGNTTNYKLSLGNDAKAKLAKAATALQTVEGDSNITATKDATDPTKVKLALNKNLTADSLTLGDKAGDHAVVNKDGLTIANGPSVKKDGINAGNKKITGVANGNVVAGSTDAVNGGQLAEVKSKADSAVQNVVSANPTALTATKAGDTVTLTPNVIAGDLVNPATGAVNTPAAGDAGKLVTAGTVANALANTHFVVDTAKTDGELDAASKHDQKIKSGNKVTLQAGKNLKAKQTNAADGATVEFSLKDSISLTQVTAGTGDNQVVLGNNGVQVGGNTYINKDGLNANNKPISNVADGVKPKDAVNKGQLDAVAQEAAKHTTVKAGQNVEVTEANNAAGGKEYTVKTADNLNVASVKAGDSTLNTDGLTIAGGPSVKKDGINAGDKKITGVADGNVAAGSKDAVNGGQLAEVKAKADSAVQNVVSANPTALTATKAGDTVTLTPNFIAGNLVDPTTGAVNTPAAGDEGKLVSAKTVADALKANHFVVDTKANGGKTEAGSEENAKVGSGNKVTFEAGKNLVAQQTNTANGGATVNYKLSDTLENLVSVKSAEIEAGIGPNKVVLNNNGVKVGDSTLNDKGLTINNGPSVTDAGIDAGNKKITGVADGNVAAGSTDAVNGGQLAEVKAKADSAVQDVKSGDENALTAVKDPNTNIVTVTPKLSGDLVDANGNITAPTTPADKGKLVTAGTVAEALANTHFVVDTKATDGELDAASQADQKIKASNKVTLQAGKNLKAKQTNGANGAEVEFSLKDSISLKEVKVGEGSANEVVLNNNGVNVAGNTYINKDGLNANGNKVANVKAGDVSATSTDAVNGAQLHNVATSVANVLGGNAAVDGNGNVTSSDIGGTGKGTVHDAIAAVNATAAKHTTVVEGKNVKVTKGKNAAGGDEYTVATKDDLDVTSVTAGNTTVNTNGLTITGGPSVTRGGIDAGNRIISGVKAGDVSATSQEAVNGSQLHATNTKLDGVKAKADTAVQDVKSGDENALTAVKDPNTNIVTVTPKLSGDLVDANGNITAPTTPADKGKLVTAGTVADALANTHFVVDTKATDGELDAASQADQKIKAGNKVTLQAGKNLKAKQTNGANGAQVEFSLKDSISLTQVTAGDSTLNTDGLTIAGGPSVKKDGINAGDKTITNVAPGAVTAASKDAVNGGQLYNVANNVKDLIGPDAAIDPATGKVTVADPAKGIGETGKGTIGEAIKSVKDKADTAVQDIKSGDEKALSVTKAGNTYTITPNLSGDLVDADGNITAPATDADKGKLVTAGTVAQALANTHFVVDTKATDGELDGASEADQKIKAGNKVTLQAGKNLKAKQTNGANGAEVEFSLKDSISLTQVTAGDSTLNTDGLTIAGGPSVKKDGINAGDKKITNVAPGAVTPTSKDAVNGSQLYNVADNVKDLIGPDATIDPATGKVTVADPTQGIAGTGKGTIGEAIKSVKDKADTAVQDIKSGDEKALSVTKAGNTYTITPNLSGDLVDADGNITAPATDADKGKLVTAGTVAQALANTHFVVDTKATDGELDGASEADQKIKAGNKVTLQAGKNLKAKQTNGANGAQVEFSLKDSISLKEVTAGEGDNQVVLGNDGVKVGGNTYINKDGLNANNKVISNVADGVNPNDAVNKGQLDAVGKEAAKHTTVKAGKNVEVTEGTNAAGGKEYTVKTADNLDVTSVKAGDSTLNTDGLTIAGGPSVKKDGINAGDKKITNVAPGAVTPTSKDAVNGSQLYNVADNVKDLIGPDATIDPATGKVTVADPAKGIGETGKGNIGDAIKHVNDAAKAAADTAKKHTTVEQGDNILVEESLNADGGKHYKVSTARDLNVDSVKAGDTTVNNDGVTIAGGPSVTKGGINAGGNTITNVADGVNDTDAVNKGQLDKVAQNVVNVLGGNATVNGNGDITMSNIGDTGKGNVNDAIKAVNDLAKKAAAEKTSVKAKDGRSNVTVTEGVNAAGGHEYTVDVERAVTEAGSDQVTVTSKHDADSNTTTYTVDVSDKTKASLAKADSAVQGLTSKDGNLNFNKDPNGNVEVSFNDNLNVKNVTTDRVQVANGPSMTKDGINAAGKAISNVANGNVAADSKDAVNGGQLYDTAKSVADVIGGGATVKDGKVVAGQNGIGNTGQNTVHGAIAAINQNTANNFNQIRGDLRKMDRDLRGGIAGALATAGLPQAFRPGKSMVAAAASTYRGQSGLAIGVSRISDNGKIILKVTGNTNSRGDFGGTIGAGYQW